MWRNRIGVKDGAIADWILLRVLIALPISVLLTTIWVVVHSVCCFGLVIIIVGVAVGVVAFQGGEIFVNLVASFDEIVLRFGALLLLCLARVAYRRILKSVTVEDGNSFLSISHIGIALAINRSAILVHPWRRWEECTIGRTWVLLRLPSICILWVASFFEIATVGTAHEKLLLLDGWYSWSKIVAKDSYASALDLLGELRLIALPLRASLVLEL